LEQTERVAQPTEIRKEVGVKYFKYVWFLVVLLALAACGQDVAPDTAQVRNAAAPTITSDKADYAPGELVTLTGSNWQAGESVRIVVDDDGLQEKVWKRDVTVTADDAGDLIDQFNLPDWFVADYIVNATGEISGTATTAFTDGNVNVRADGISSTATITVDWEKWNGTNSASNTTCSGNRSSYGSVSAGTNSWTTTAAASQHESVRLSAPSEAENKSKTFVNWTDGSTVVSTQRTFCTAGSNGTLNLRANYAAAPAKIDTTTTLASSPNPSVFGQSVTFTATVTPASGTNEPAGTITFKNGTTTLGTGTLSRVGTTNKASATFSTSSLAVNTAGHSITAEYGGDTGFNTSTSTALAQVVNKAATSTVLQSSLNPSTEGQSVTFTANVSVTSPGTGTASGNVQFKVDGTNAGSPVALNSSAQATYTTSSLAVGNRSVTAVYLGSSNYNGSTSAELSQTVNAACVVPSITTHPADVTVTVGGAATFSVSAGGTGTLSYQWRKDGNNIQGATSASYDVTGITSDNAGNYSAVVTNSCGTVTSSAATLTVNKADQTISFATGTPTTKTYGDADFTVSATATSGLNVSFAAKDNSTCSVSSSGTVSNLRVGDCIIVASQAGNSNYNAAPAVEHEIVVGKAAAEISLSGLEHTYNGSTKAVTVTTNPANLTGVTVTYNNSATAPTNAGNYAVVATLTNDSYQLVNADGQPINSVSNTLVISKAAATIELGGLSHIYSGQAKAATATTNPSGKNVNFVYSQDGNTVASPTNSGSYSVTATIDDPNYQGSESGTLVIDKAPLTVTASNQTVVYGTDPDDFTVNYDGFVNGENESVLGGSLSFTGAGTNVGTYTITPAGLTSSNYEISFVAGRLEITKASSTTTVTVSDGTFNGQPQGDSATVTGAGGLNESVAISYTGRNGTNYGPSSTAPTNSGDYTATASYAGSINHFSSSDSKNFSIAKAATTTTVSCSTGPFTYNGSAQTPCSASVTGAGGLNESPTVTYSNNTNAGPATASASYEGGVNHNGSTGSTTFTINSRTITVTADAKSKFYGDADPALTYSVISGSLVNSDSFSGTLSRAAGESVGTYAIQQGSLSAGSNYNLTFVGASLTIGAWTPQGFHSPIGISNSFYQAPGGAVPTATSSTVWQTAKGGSTLPLKFNVFAGSVEKTSTTDVKGFGAAKLSSCSGSTNDPIEELATAGSSSLRYDSSERQFIQNWKTSTVSSDTCYRVTVTFQDASAIHTFVRLRK
jgi:hypothetical protein